MTKGQGRATNGSRSPGDEGARQEKSAFGLRHWSFFRPSSSIFRRFLRFARLFLLVYILFLVACASLQRKLIYFPSRAPESVLLAEARDLGLEPWRDASGALIGWVYRHPRQPAQNRFLVFHGNAGFALDRVYYVSGFGGVTDCDVHLLEYPGYGCRTGSPSQDALLDAGESALRSLKAQSATPVYLVGESIGSGVAAGVAARAPDLVAGIVFVTPMTSLTDVAAHHYPALPIRLFLADRFPTIEWLKKFHGPVAFTVAGQDEVIPNRLGRALFDSYAGPKRLWVKPGMHNTMLNEVDATWWREVVAFVEGGDKSH